MCIRDRFTGLITRLLISLFRSIIQPESSWRNGLSLARIDPVPDGVIGGYRRPIMALDWERGIINFTRAALNKHSRNLVSDDFIDLIAAIASIGHAAPPILIVHGEEDKLVPLQNSIKLKRTLPTATLATMTGCGHVPHEENPTDFTKIVENYLQDLESMRINH